MIAVIGGLAAACCWAGTGFLVQRGSRAVGELSAFAWAAAFGLLFAAVPAGLALASHPVAGGTLALLALSGLLNVAGLVAQFAALARGPLHVIVPITSSEGAVAAVAAAIGGTRLGTLGWVALSVVVVGILVSAVVARRADERSDRSLSLLPLSLTIVAALCFGCGLYLQGHLADGLPLGIAVAPPSLMGTVVIAAPMLIARRLARPGRALPVLIGIGAAELLGFLTYVLGARQSVPVAAVLSAQYPTITVIASVLVLGERPTRSQLLGLALIIAGVTTLSLH